VSISVAGGSVHALVGENGAGKSTLGQIISGAVTLGVGEMRLRGERVQFSHPRDALTAGVALVHQEIALAPSMTVSENIFLGAEPSSRLVLRRGELRRRLAELMEETGLMLDPDQQVGDLRVGEQQIVEILRALVRDVDLIVMDEPTAPLSPTEVDHLKQVIGGLRESGKTIVYISHKLEEVLDLADTVSVLKDGKLVETRPATGTSTDHLITAMLGRALSSAFPEKRLPPADAPVVLEARGLCRDDLLDDVSFSLKAGEVVGFAGLVGSGRTEVARAVFGADPLTSGTLTLRGQEVSFHSCRDAVDAGVAMLPEDRKHQGLVMNGSIRENLTLPSLSALCRRGVLSRRLERQAANDLVEMVDVRGAGVELPISSLSGGNQQKVALGKWLHRPPQVFILDEPTRGVDVGAKRSIYDLIVELAAGGMAVMVISSELLEVRELAHRIMVMHRGRIVAELAGDAGEEQILSAAFGRENRREEA
jgi:ABC-type sugar transport system ATPase subunit